VCGGGGGVWGGGGEGLYRMGGGGIRNGPFLDALHLAFSSIESRRRHNTPKKKPAPTPPRGTKKKALSAMFTGFSTHKGRKNFDWKMRGVYSFLMRKEERVSISGELGSQCYAAQTGPFT